MSVPNPATGIADDECSIMQVKALESFKGNSNKKEQFKNALRDCAFPMIEKFFNSFPK